MRNFFFFLNHNPEIQGESFVIFVSVCEKVYIEIPFIYFNICTCKCWIDGEISELVASKINERTSQVRNQTKKKKNNKKAPLQVNMIE